jgi:hypothetical protein
MRYRVEVMFDELNRLQAEAVEANRVAGLTIDRMLEARVQ